MLNKKKIPDIVFPIVLSLLVLAVAVCPAATFLFSHNPQNTNEALLTLYSFIFSGIFFYAGLLVILIIWAVYVLLCMKKTK